MSSAFIKYIKTGTHGHGSSWSHDCSLVRVEYKYRGSTRADYSEYTRTSVNLNATFSPGQSRKAGVVISFSSSSSSSYHNPFGPAPLLLCPTSEKFKNDAHVAWNNSKFLLARFRDFARMIRQYTLTQYYSYEIRDCVTIRFLQWFSDYPLQLTLVALVACIK
jgi:hypothetical protein